MNDTKGIDHRTRVAAERRERMRARLVESAFAVFAERGVGASVIQEVIAAAGVSQGTFYNYFRTNEELLQAVTEELHGELVTLIESAVTGYVDPALRIASGVRMYLHKARAFPLFARFVVHTGLHLLSPNNPIYEYLPPHIEAGFASGRFKTMPMEVALDLIAGVALLAIARIAAGKAAPDYPELAVAALLRALGVTPAQAEKLVTRPLAALAGAVDSLAKRATARARVTQDVAVSEWWWIASDTKRSSEEACQAFQATEGVIDIQAPIPGISRDIWELTVRLAVDSGQFAGLHLRGRVSANP